MSGSRALWATVLLSANGVWLAVRAKMGGSNKGTKARRGVGSLCKGVAFWRMRLPGGGGVFLGLRGGVGGVALEMSSSWQSPQPVNLVDLGFMDARSKLIDLAAFLDRVQRAGQEGDFRVKALKEAIGCLDGADPGRAREVLLRFSDLTTEPIERATVQGAVGAVAI